MNVYTEIVLHAKLVCHRDFVVNNVDYYLLSPKVGKLRGVKEAWVILRTILLAYLV